MSGQHWFSAALVVVVSNGAKKSRERITSVVLLRAGDFEEALEIAHELGRDAEEHYKTGQGETVRWTFESVASVDMLPETLWSGVEVHCSTEEIAESFC